MKKLLLIFGIIIIVAGVVSMLFAALNRFAYYHTLDGSADLYQRLQRRMTVSLVIGIALAVIGTALLIIRIFV
ncbi:MAG: hypothetical protein J5950_08625 [Clostridia bacterium]|nr:hypothetical protein [Clostridia bacterium]